MEDLVMTAFNVIGAVGTAKSCVMESMVLAREGKFEDARNKIKEANEMIKIGEEEHFKVITKESKAIQEGGSVALNLLYIHAEDQLMTTVVLRDTALEMIESNKMIYDLSRRIEALESK